MNKQTNPECQIFVLPNTILEFKVMEKIIQTVYSNSVQPHVWAQLTYLAWWLTDAFGSFLDVL